MKSKNLVLFLILLPVTAFSQTIILEGNYQGKNMYIQDPYASDGAYCTDSIFINGKKIVFEAASGYEIKLTAMNFQPGEPLKIEIFHKADCKPKVIQEMITPKNTF
jgi:hypothetical protein